MAGWAALVAAFWLDAFVVAGAALLEARGALEVRVLAGWVLVAGAEANRTTIGAALAVCTDADADAVVRLGVGIAVDRGSGCWWPAERWRRGRRDWRPRPG